MGKIDWEHPGIHRGNLITGSERVTDRVRVNQSILFQNTCIYYTVFTGIHVYILKYYYTYISKKPI